MPVHWMGSPAHRGGWADNLKLPVEVATQPIGILAKPRAGNGYTAKGLVEQLFTSKQQVMIADPKWDWWGIRSSADGKSPGLPDGNARYNLPPAEIQRLVADFIAEVSGR
jgi:hypothetical protein